MSIKNTNEPQPTIFVAITKLDNFGYHASRVDSAGCHAMLGREFDARTLPSSQLSLIRIRRLVAPA